MESSLIVDLIQRVMALPLGTTRWVMIVTVMPLFSMLAARGILELAAAFALGFPLVVSLFVEAPSFDFGLGMLTLLMVKEALVGALLGLLFGVPFWAAQAAGDIFDNVKGEAQGNVADPRSADEMLLTGRFLSMIYTLYLLTGGGFLILIGTVYDSFEIWPVTSFLPDVSIDSLDPFFSFIQRILLLALIIGGPLIAFIFIVDVMVSFMARAAPNMEALTFGFAVKSFVGAIVLIAYMMIIRDVFEHTTSYYEEIIGMFEALLNGGR